MLVLFGVYLLAHLEETYNDNMSLVFLYFLYFLLVIRTGPDPMKTDKVN